MPNKHDLSHSLRKIPYDGKLVNVLQNVSDNPIEWTADRGSNDYYFLQPGDFLKLNYDVWVKSDTHGVSHLVAGTFPSTFTYTYRADVVKNKTYTQTKGTVGNATTTLAVMADFPELTIQKQKNIKLTIRVPAISTGSSFNGLTVQTAVKVNGVDRILSDSDRVTCQTSDGRMAEAYNKVFILDLISDGIVAEADADSPYTLRVKLSGQTMSGSCRISSTAGVNDSSGMATHGTLLNSARSQNYLGIIVEELDR